MVIFFAGYPVGLLSVLDVHIRQYDINIHEVAIL